MVKNIEHSERTTSSPMKGDEHSCDFQRGFPPVPQPWGPSLAARWCQGQRTRIRNFPFSDCKLKKPLKNYYMGRRFFFTEVWTRIRCPQSAVRSPRHYVVRFDASYIM